MKKVMLQNNNNDDDNDYDVDDNFDKMSFYYKTTDIQTQKPSA